MSENLLISVIIPCYNGEKFIQEAIESVINQSYQNWELVIVDDGSTDNSKNIVRKYITDRRIKLIEHGSNRGIPKTKNTGIKVAKGDYLAFLDQDDIWFPDKLKMQVNYLSNQKENVGMVCTGMIFTDEKLKSQRIFMGFKDDNQKELVKSLYLQPTNSSSVMMVKKECFFQLGFYNEDLHGWDDYEMWMRIATHYKIKYIKKAMVKKRMHTENVQRLPQVQKEEKKVFDQALQLHPFLNAYKDEKEARILYSEAVMLIEQNEINKAKLKLTETIRKGYLIPRTVFLFILIFFLGNHTTVVKNQLSKVKHLLQRILVKVIIH